jgi:hypothetical protein
MITRERESATPVTVGDQLDRAGVAVSCLCALHCALLPVAVAALPMVGLGLLAEEGSEAALIGTSAALGTISLGLGFRRHRSGRALAVLAIGVGMIALGRFAEARAADALGMIAVVSGGLAIAGSHLLNRRLCRSCPQCREAGPGSIDSPTRAIALADRGKGEEEAQS